MREEILAVIPQQQDRLEVVWVEDGEGKKAFELRRLLWGEGVGWYRLHTFRLEPGGVEALLKTLRQARRRLKGEKGWGQVVPFPLQGEARKKQRAV